MTDKIFINLPVKNLERSVAFFTSLGFAFNPQFTDDTATCMIVSEHIFVMLLVEKRFADFTKKEIADATKTTEVLLALNIESREAVDTMIAKAVEAGGSVYMEPTDHGWMYLHSFADLDGHQWEIAWMDMAQLPQQEQAAGKQSITVETIVKASVEKVWQCWTQPEHIQQWNNTSDDWYTPRATNDLQVGGKFLSSMEARDGSMGFDFEGVYTKVVPHVSIEYIIADGRKVSITFLEQEAGCKVTETFEAEDENTLELQQSGWQAILDNFKRYAESL